MTEQSILWPTGDLVTYSPDNGVEYSYSNEVATFSTLWASKIHGKQLTALEIASSGKIALSPGDEHSFDISLDPGNDAIVLQARNARTLTLSSEDRNASLALDDLGGAILHTDAGLAIDAAEGSNTLQLNNGGLAVSVLQGSNVFAVSSGSSHDFVVGTDSILRVANGGVALSNVTIGGTDLTVPIGDSNARPAGENGMVFYNSSASRFEGFSSGAWSGLGGVVDVDQDTFVSAESGPGVDDDNLVLYTAGVERMRITDVGKVGIGSSNPEFDFDILGNVRISGSLTVGGDAKVMSLATDESGSTDLLDGEFNDGAGMVISGAPTSDLLNSQYVSRFEKSIRWRKNRLGMPALLGEAPQDEPYWDVRGGGLRVTGVNPNSGSEVSYTWRIGSNDQLDFVKVVRPADGGRETYELLQSIGHNRDPGAFSAGSSTGSFVADANRTSMANGVVSAVVSAFMAYDDFRVYAAIYHTAETPTSGEVIAAATAHGYAGTQLLPKGDNTLNLNLTAMADGSPVPNELVKIQAVLVRESDAQTSPVPLNTFVFNSESFVDSLFEGDAQASVGFNLNFADWEWDTLSATDQAVFVAWLEQSVIDDAASRGIDITDVDITVVNGSIDASVTMSYPTAQNDKVMTVLISEPSPMSMLGEPQSIPFVDETVRSISPSSVARTVSPPARKKSAPKIDTVVLSSVAGSMHTFTVAASDPLDTIASVHVLVSTSAVPPTSRNVVSSVNAQSFPLIAGTASVVLNISLSATSYVYFVAKSSIGMLTKPSTQTIKPFGITMPPSTALDDDLRPAFAFFSLDDDAVSTKTGITVTNGAVGGGTASLLLYAQGDNLMPTNAIEMQVAFAASLHGAQAALAPA